MAARRRAALAPAAGRRADGRLGAAPGMTPRVMCCGGRRQTAGIWSYSPGALAAAGDHDSPEVAD